MRLSNPPATALVGETGAVAFSPPDVAIGALEVDRIVLDGPLAAAREGADVREGERAVGSPIRTPDRLPETGSRPFAETIRRSIEGVRSVLGKRRIEEDLFEARADLAWRALAGPDLPSKAVESGRQARARALEKAGLRLPTGSTPTMAQLDATVCALLGVLHDVGRAELVGAPAFQDAAGEWREGRILMPPGAGAGAAAKAADWVCFVNEPRAARFETYRLAVEEGVIARTLFQAGPLKVPLANVTKLRAGQSILLAQSARGGHRPLGLFRVSDGAVVKHPNLRGRPWTFSGFTRVYAPELVARLEAAGGRRDPHLDAHVAIAVTLERDVQDASIALKRGGEAGALVPWSEVIR